MEKDFEEEFADELQSIATTIKFSVKVLEMFWKELQKSSLPEDVKMTLIKNYKVEGDK